jgi:predicted nucleic acid-binding protein
MVIVLDTFPTSSVSKRPGRRPSPSDLCQKWVDECEDAGHTVLVPAITYYEALRELEQRQAKSQIERLKDFCLLSTRFIPLTTAHIETAARLWGHARRIGRPTASDDSLDGDMILAAQALSLGLPTSDYIVATTNVRHLSMFVHAGEWTNIKP